MLATLTLALIGLVACATDEPTAKTDQATCVSDPLAPGDGDGDVIDPCHTPAPPGDATSWSEYWASQAQPTVQYTASPRWACTSWVCGPGCIQTVCSAPVFVPYTDYVGVNCSVINQSGVVTGSCSWQHWCPDPCMR